MERTQNIHNLVVEQHVTNETTYIIRFKVIVHLAGKIRIEPKQCDRMDRSQEPNSATQSEHWRTGLPVSDIIRQTTERAVMDCPILHYLLFRVHTIVFSSSFKFLNRSWNAPKFTRLSLMGWNHILFFFLLSYFPLLLIMRQLQFPLIK